MAYLVYDNGLEEKEISDIETALPDLPFPLDVRASSYFNDSQVAEYFYSPLLFTFPSPSSPTPSPPSSPPSSAPSFEPNLKKESNLGTKAIKQPKIKEIEIKEKIKGGTKQMGIKEETKQMGIKEGTKQMGIKEETKQMGIKEGTKQMGIKGRTKQMEIKEGTEIKEGNLYVKEAVERIVLWQNVVYCVTPDCSNEYWLINNVSFQLPPLPLLHQKYFQNTILYSPSSSKSTRYTLIPNTSFLVKSSQQKKKKRLILKNFEKKKNRRGEPI